MTTSRRPDAHTDQSQTTTLSTQPMLSRKWALASFWQYDDSKKLSFFKGLDALEFFEQFNDLELDEGYEGGEGDCPPCQHQFFYVPLLPLSAATQLLTPLFVCLNSEEKVGEHPEDQLEQKNQALLQAFNKISSVSSEMFARTYKMEVVEEFSLEDDICSFILAPNFSTSVFGHWKRIFFFLKKEDFMMLDSRLQFDNMSVCKHQYHGQFNQPVSREQLENNVEDQFDDHYTYQQLVSEPNLKWWL